MSEAAEYAYAPAPRPHPRRRPLGAKRGGTKVKDGAKETRAIFEPKGTKRWGGCLRASPVSIALCQPWTLEKDFPAARRCAPINFFS